jgi:hypothetical protein
MSFLSGNPAAATVAPSLCIEWRAERLRQLLADTKFRNAMLMIFSKNLVAKLGAGAARLEGWGSLDNDPARK